MERKLLLVAAARPNFMKIAALVDALVRHSAAEGGGASRGRLRHVLIHTGQHYDERMSKLFFDELAIPRPAIDLGVGSGSHARQTAEVLVRIEPVLIEERPDMVVVVGDVNSTLACALAAAKLNIPVAHVEAGLRSFDRTMPEEVNRVLTDAVSDLLFTSCEDADRNLAREGIPAERVHLVGNVMIDTLLKHRRAALGSDVTTRLGLGHWANGDVRRYGLLTLHRPSNVDAPEAFEGILRAVARVAEEVPVVFPMHPRSRKRAVEFGLDGLLEGQGTGSSWRGVRVTEPLGYLDFLALMDHASLVLTDSGGVQEETTILGVPCLTLRENTERPVTITEGTSELVGAQPSRIVDAALRRLAGPRAPSARPRLWDGRAAERIVAILSQMA
jgi:UDP-N-acetylglucosamine 2-epimerase (non-hydrolysing)